MSAQEGMIIQCLYVGSRGSVLEVETQGQEVWGA